MHSTASSFKGPASACDTRAWLVVLAVLVAVGSMPLHSVWAQRVGSDTLTLIERYRYDRFRQLATEYLNSGPVPTRPPKRLATGGDALPSSSNSRSTASAQEERPSFPIRDVRPVRHLERGWFKRKFRDTNWSFLGPGLRLTFLDTARTRDLRARLQTRFGAPTRTAAELDLDSRTRRPDSSQGVPSQFEYWFVVNDSIPVKVTDVKGPRERGLIVSTDRTLRERLHALRQGVLGPLRREERSPYVDYFYSTARNRWYRTGFDGEAFFLEPIPRYDIVPGKRPRLDTVRTTATPAESEDASPFR